MTDAIGRLTSALAGRYRVERELGQGGMATVYLAHDMKHDRQVALKVLHPELAAVIGAQRFLTEIKTTASLHHPHILPLHDSGEVEGTVFYVMPYVGGKSLRDRLGREKQLPVADAIRITVEVAGALDYAHEHGVVHRDIKPENILLHEGHALVADFGIALAVSRSEAGARLTETGMSLGTPHYMSPEQAMGERELTGRSDVYALGCVLYEMLAGEPPYTGPTAQAVVSKVMAAEPASIAVLRKTVPPGVAAAVHIALHKVPADRWATAGEFAAALQGTREIPAAAGRAPARPAWQDPRVAVLGVVAVAALAWGAVGWLRSAAGPATPTRWLSLVLPDSARLVFQGAAWQEGRSLDVSPDGTRLVYVAETVRGTPRLYVRSLERPEFRPLAGTDSAFFPFFSPDGRWVGFFAGGQLRKVSVDGGTPVALGDVREPAGAAWVTADGILVSEGSGLIRFSASTGRRSATPATCTAIQRPCWLPNPLPGGEWVLVSGYRDIGAVSLRTGERRTVLDSLFEPQARLLPNGAMAYFQRPGVLFAVPFDLSRLKAGTMPVPLIDGIRQGGIGSQYAVSGDGTLVYAPGGHYIRSRFAWVTRGGAEAPLPFEAQSYGVFNLSPDGRYLAGTVYRTNPQIWIYDLERGSARPLVSEGSAEQPVWSPDGRSIAFAARRGGGRNPAIMVIAADGSAPARVLVEDGGYPYSWSAGGRLSLVRAGQGATGDDIWVASVATGAVDSLVVSDADDAAPYFSPDGRWIAYMSRFTARWEVYVEPYPPTGRRWTVSDGGGSFPRWSADGRGLYYERDGVFFVVDLSRGPGRASRPVRLFKGPYVETFGQAFDVARDGRRFLVLRAADPRATIAGLTVVLRWTREVEARLREARGAGGLAP
jgi:Tol biopolymer transport system component/tRNA A-37 threonylcarbamoyl transferase component Bud32